MKRSWSTLRCDLLSSIFGCLLSEGKWFLTCGVFQLSLVETYPLVILQRESGGKYTFTSLYSRAQEYLIDLSFELKVWVLLGIMFLLSELIQPLTLLWEIEKMKYHLIYLCIYVNRVSVVHCTTFKIYKCLLQYPVYYLILNRLFFPVTVHPLLTKLWLSCFLRFNSLNFLVYSITL